MNKPKRLTLGTTLLVTSLSLHAATGTQIIQIGLVDSEHFVSGNYTSIRSAMTTPGQVLGYANRYTGTTYNGQSSWLYNGVSSFEIGLMDAEHTRNDGYRYNQTGVYGIGSFFNNAGQVAGYARRYNGGSTLLGQSAWLYDGSSSFQIGLTGASHTRSTDEYQINEVKVLNNNGQVLGTAARYDSVTALGAGQSSWLYNGTSTINIGLTDAGHTRADGYQHSFSNLLNDAGQAAGTSKLYNGSDTSLQNGQSAWMYNGSSTTAIGLNDATHTGVDGYHSSGAQSINAAGQVLGHTQRYSGGSTNLGQSAWVYNGTSTTQVGLTNSINTRADGYQRSYSQHFNEAGQAGGYSYRYNGSLDIGYAAWVYNGSSTNQVGLTDAAHTKSTDGYQSSFVDVLNNAGQAVGQSNSYSAGGSSVGESAWFYNGSTSVEIGLDDAQHTSTANQRTNDVTHLNEAGQVAGHADRYNDSQYYYLGGQSAWAFDGADTVQIGLTDATHTKIKYSDGADHQYNQIISMNETGQVAGYALRFGDAIDSNLTTDTLGQTAWLYDSLLGNTNSLLFSERSDGYAFSDIAYLGDDGLVLGSYELFDTDDTFLGLRAFSYSVDDGFVDLIGLIDGGLAAAGWQELSNLLLASSDGNGTGFLVGNGVLADGANGLYLMTTSAVPVPAAVWLFGTGLLGLIGFAKRKRQ